MDRLPLFPLQTVLFPGGVLPLRIFEPRYVDMISHCMRHGEGFGVVLIREGMEARLSPQSNQPDVFETGTQAEIIDFNQADNGLLGIVVRGTRKFVIRDLQEQDDHLLIGHVEFQPEEPAGELSDEHEPLVSVLRELTNHPLVEEMVAMRGAPINFEEARSVSLSLAELLPIDAQIKQSLLQLRWPRERLAELARIVGKLQE